MPLFYFRTKERDGHCETSTKVEFKDEAAALAQARLTLADLATEGLPSPDIGMIAVELLDEEQRALYEIRLTIEEIPRTSLTP